MGWYKKEKRYGGEDYMAKRQRLYEEEQYRKRMKSPPNLFLMGLLGFLTAAVMMGIIFVICQYM
jgi:hypothetical protein